jgi:hypothetical protein
MTNSLCSIGNLFLFPRLLQRFENVISVACGNLDFFCLFTAVVAHCSPNFAGSARRITSSTSFCKSAQAGLTSFLYGSPNWGFVDFIRHGHNRRQAQNLPVFLLIKLPSRDRLPGERSLKLSRECSFQANEAADLFQHWDSTGSLTRVSRHLRDFESQIWRSARFDRQTRMQKRRNSLRIASQNSRGILILSGPDSHLVWKYNSSTAGIPLMTEKDTKRLPTSGFGLNSQTRILPDRFRPIHML